jgi:chorismate synthase
VAITLAEAMLEKLGGDSLGEVKRNLAGYWAQLRSY